MDFHGPRTQIFKEAKATNSNAIIYTVPIDKVFWIIESMLVTDAGAAGKAEVEIRDENDVHIRHLNFVDVRSNNQGIVCADHFEPGWPIEMSAGEDIVVISDTGSLEAHADIFGFEVDI